MAFLHEFGFLIAGLACALACAPTPARACSCAESAPPPCESYWAADAVFLGTVVDVSVMEPDTTKGQTRRRRELSALLMIHESWRGIEPMDSALIEVRTAGSGAECGVSFHEGWIYLVYASRGSDGILRAGACGRVRAITGAAPSPGKLPGHSAEEIARVSERFLSEDIDYFKSVPGAGRSGSLFGEITDRPNEQRGGGLGTREAPRRRLAAPGVKVIVTLEEGRALSTEPDSTGFYRIEGIPPGRHAACVVAPTGYVVHGRGEGFSNVSEFTIEIRGPADCARRSFALYNDGRIEGRVRDAANAPAAGVGLSLIPTRGEERDDAAIASRVEALRAWTDQSGAYAFERVPRGEYLLAANSPGPPSAASPLPASYFPGALDERAAEPISVDAGARVGLPDFPLPPALPLRTLEARAFWPDGIPAAGALFAATTPDGIGVPTRADGDARTDSRGHAELDLLAGREYSVMAKAFVHGSWHHGHYADASPVVPAMPLSIVLSEPGPQCARCRR